MKLLKTAHSTSDTCDKVEGYINKKEVLNGLDKILKSSEVTGPARVMIQKLAVDVTNTNTEDLKRNEKTTVKKIQAYGGQYVFTYCRRCGKIVSEYDVFCSGCGREIQMKGERR